MIPHLSKWSRVYVWLANQKKLLEKAFFKKKNKGEKMGGGQLGGESQLGIVALLITILSFYYNFLFFGLCGRTFWEYNWQKMQIENFPRCR